MRSNMLNMEKPKEFEDNRLIVSTRKFYGSFAADFDLVTTIFGKIWPDYVVLRI